MNQIMDELPSVIDFVTGRKLPRVGSEENRQAVEKFLVEQKGFLKSDIEVGVRIAFEVSGRPYASAVDLIVALENRRLVAVKCAAGSLGSREREILAAARIVDAYQVPCSVVSDGRTAIILDTVTGKKRGEGLDKIWSREQALLFAGTFKPVGLTEERIQKERLIFRTYDVMNVNVVRPGSHP
jgi:hypothetical protein